MTSIQTEAFINAYSYVSHIDALVLISKRFNTSPPRSHKSITAKLVLAEVHDE